MHVLNSENALLANADEDSMGRVIDGVVRIDSTISPRRAAIEKAQAELRQEYDVREERKRELEFLEKGGNPLDFKADPATSISPHSTSVGDQLGEQFVNSEARGSAALPVSPHADSVDSSGRVFAVLSKYPSSVDNLLDIDDEDKMTERKRNSYQFSRRGARLGNFSALKESDFSAVLRLEAKGQAYARRNRSRPNRDSAHADSTNLVKSGTANIFFNVPPVLSEPKGVKRLTCEGDMTADPKDLSICNSETASPNDNIDSRPLASDNQNIVVAGTQNLEIKNEFMEAPFSDVVRETRQSENIQFFQTPDEQVNHIDGFIKDVKKRVLGEPDCEHDKAFDAIEKLPSAPNSCSLSAEAVNNIHDEDQKKECGVSRIEITDSIVNEQTEINNLLLNNVDCGLGEAIDTDVKFTSVSNGCILLGEVAMELQDGDHKKLSGLTPDAGSFVNEINCLIPDKLVCSASECSKVFTSSSQEISPAFDEVMLKKNAFAFDVQSNDTGDADAKVVSTKIIHESSETNADGQCSKNPDELGLLKPDASLDTLRNNSTAKNTSLMQGSSMISMLLLKNEPPVFAEYQPCSENLLKETHVDAILEKAQAIEAYRKRSGEVSTSGFCSETGRKSHWDFVLEEMAWLANDFMQERTWKIAAASQISHLVALAVRSKLKDAVLLHKQRLAAHTLAKAVIQFWNSAKVLFSRKVSEDLKCSANFPIFEDLKFEERNATNDKAEDRNFKNNGEKISNECEKHHNVMAYAVRFLKDNVEHSSRSVHAEALRTPDRLFDSGIMVFSENIEELQEDLFFAVPFGAMENYRKSVESLWMHYEKSGNGIQLDGRLAAWLDSTSGALENTCEEDECDAGMLYFSESAYKFSRSTQRKKNIQKYIPRSYENESELAYGNFVESKPGNLHILVNGKRPLNSPHVGSIPTKRARTAARQRVSGPVTSVPTPMPAKTDVSSGDTCSYQDDQSSLHGGPQMQRNVEVESTGEYGRHLPFDGTGMSVKHKKKKKPKHLVYKNSLHSADSETYLLSARGSSYDHRWQGKPIGQHEQRDFSKRKLETHNFGSIASNGTSGQPTAKKLKLWKQQPDVSPESMGVGPGSTPSVASQMSNMAYPIKIMKIFANRGPGKKSKALKISGVTSGAGCPWSLLEDQALVVLVHDMGPNWELVSDIMNSTLHFKCIFRKPKECKERHKILMDRNSGDGADSAEDSGSSQPYPSTLPGIPKGRARLLFQHLQGPLEQDVLKAHFEKIIEVGQQLHLQRNQSNNHEAKQIMPVHGSHVIALSQVCPNVLNGAILTPLDLCDTTSSSPDGHSLGYSGSHGGGLPVSNHQGSLSSSSFVNNAVQVTSAMVFSNGFTSTSAASSPASRYAGPRSISSPLDERQRIHQYNQIPSGRNVQQSGMSNSGTLQVGNDRAVCMVPGSNGMGMICGMNRGAGIPRQGFQGMGSPAPMLNMASPGSIMPHTGMPGPTNMHTGPVSGQENSMPRPRDTLTSIRPGQNSEDQRRMMMQEFQMQTSQGNCQGTPPGFSGISSAFTNPVGTSPVQNIPLQHQSQQQMPHQSHLLNGPHHPQLQQGANSGSPQQQAFANQVAKDRQMQQRLMPQQQHFTSTNSSISYPPQSQAHHPVSSMQNELQPPAASVSPPIPNAQHSLTQPSSQMSTFPTQAQPKRNQTPHSLGQLGASLTNQVLKQRQRQQLLQQQQRSHIPQQRQQPSSVQQAKVAKGLGRGANMMHQNFPIDSAHVNNHSPPNEMSKGEPTMQQMMLIQGVYSGTTGSNACQPGRQLLSQPSNSLQHQQKQFSRSHPHKQVSLSNGHVDGNNQGQATQLQPNQNLPPSQVPLSSSSLSMQTNLSRQSLQRMLPTSNLQHCPSDAPQSGPLEQNHIDQLASNSNATQCTDASIIAPSVSPASSSTSQWKVESPSCHSNVTGSSHRQLANSGSMPRQTPNGLEPGQTSQLLCKRQPSGSSSLLHGPNTNGQWHQESQVQQQQPMDSGPLCSQPTKLGSG